jgi:hypothetical protein
MKHHNKEICKEIIKSLIKIVILIKNLGRTQMEINRRTTLINQLKTNEKQFDQMLRNEKSAQK